ncbi:MAG: DNA-binding response regulator [Anaerolineaceae bacterium]|nr:DNA-binding response regulator [Anaerolineaceae bacterium]
MPEETIRLVIVDDHAMVRRGLATFLKASPNLELVGEAGNGAEALRLCDQVRPHVVLMDLMMPEMSGVETIEALLKEHPDIKVIALTSFKEEPLIRAALRAGATSYLLKNVSADKLAAAIHATHSGLPILSPELTDVLTSNERDYFSELTQREREVLTYMVEGMSNEEIAQELVLSASTVKNHVSSILAKLEVNSRAKAANLAIKHNLVNTI